MKKTRNISMMERIRNLNTQAREHLVKTLNRASIWGVAPVAPLPAYGVKMALGNTVEPAHVWVMVAIGTMFIPLWYGFFQAIIVVILNAEPQKPTPKKRKPKPGITPGDVA